MGLLLTSIISGRIISRTGKYRLFPILGTLLGVVGMMLLTRISITSPTGSFTCLPACWAWGWDW